MLIAGSSETLFFFVDYTTLENPLANSYGTENPESHTHTHTHTVGRTPLDEWSARSRDLYLATHNNHKRQTSMSSAGLEPEIPASHRVRRVTSQSVSFIRKNSEQFPAEWVASYAAGRASCFFSERKTGKSYKACEISMNIKHSFWDK